LLYNLIICGEDCKKKEKVKGKKMKKKEITETLRIQNIIRGIAPGRIKSAGH
jgi:hypothetical protein